MTRPVAILGWIVIGLCVARVIDYRQMRQEVPYGDLPAMMSLKWIRINLYIVCALFTPFIVLTVLLSKKDSEEES